MADISKITLPNGKEYDLKDTTARNAANTHISNKSNPHGVTKAQVGLGNVDNTADSAKSVKYAASAGSANSVAWGNVSGRPSSLPANGGNSSTVNGHTVNSDVPSGAKFTDTVYDDTAVREMIAGKQDTLTFDDTPTADSTNPVTSGGIKAYVDANAKYDDTALKNRVTTLEGKTDADTTYSFTADKATASDGTEQTVTVTKVNGHTVEADVPANAKFTDTVPHIELTSVYENDTDAVSGGAVYRFIINGGIGHDANSLKRTVMDSALSEIGISTPVDYSNAKMLMANAGQFYKDDQNCVNVLAMAEIINALCQQIDSNATGISALSNRVTVLETKTPKDLTNSIKDNYGSNAVNSTTPIGSYFSIVKVGKFVICSLNIKLKKNSSQNLGVFYGLPKAKYPANASLGYNNYSSVVTVFIRAGQSQIFTGSEIPYDGFVGGQLIYITDE